MESERSTPSQTNELDARTMPRVWPISGGTLFRHQIVVTLAIWCPLAGWSGGRRLVDTLVAEQRPGDAGCLIGHGDQHDVRRPPRQEPVGPAGPRARLGTAPAQHGSRTMHEQAPDIAIPALRYPPQPVLAATRVLPGHQTEPGRELTARAELRAIADRRDQRRRGDDADAGDRRKTATRPVGSVVPPINSVRRRNPWIPDQCQSMRTKRTRTHSSYRLTLVGNPRISAADRIYGRHRWDSNLRYVLAHRFDF